MPDQFFMPHRFEPESLELEVQGITADGTELNPASYVNTAAGTLDLTGLEDWRECRIHVSARDTGGVVRDLIGCDEQVAGAVTLMLVLRGSSCRIRSSTALRRDGDLWSGCFDLTRSGHHGSADVRAIAIRRSPRPPEGHLAFRKGEHLADSKTWRVYVDDRPAVPGGAIDNEWKKFGSDPSEHLNRIADCPWYLDLSNETKPRLIMNEDVEGLKRALSATQNTGRAARVRDALIHSVLQPVVTALVVHVLEQRVEEMDDLHEWQRGVLLSVAGKAGDDCTADVSAERWLHQWRQGNTITVLPEIAVGVQRHLEVGRGAENLVRALEE
jgi:hypothetical protein